MLSRQTYEELKKYEKRLYTGPATSEETRYLSDLGFIRPSSHESKETPGLFYRSPTEWTITPAGKDALSHFEEMTQQKAEEKSQKKKDRAFEIFLIFLGTIIGLLIEHFSGIMGFITNWH